MIFLVIYILRRLTKPPYFINERNARDAKVFVKVTNEEGLKENWT